MRHALLIAVGVVLAACTEQPQTVNPRKSDTLAWQGAENPYVASGWKAGDKRSWEEQLRMRAQAQNDYTKTK